MIQVVQGTQHQINFFLSEIHKQSDVVFVLHTNKTFPSGFYGIRMFIDFLKKTRGDQFIQQLLIANRPIAAFVYPELAKGMNDRERLEYQFFAARIESRLSVAYGLLERLAALISSLAGDENIDLLIPDIRTIDSESLRVIENYYRYHEHKNLNLYLGFTTDIIDDIDADGITWHRYQGDVQFFAGGFLQHENVEHIIPELGELAQADWGSPDEITEEEEVYNRIKSATALDDQLISEVFAQINQSYERYSYRAVMKIGLELLSREDFTSPLQRAQMHGWVGSAANYYQFTHHPNPPFDDFLVYHFQESLKHENQPEVRLAVHYRLCFTFAERRDDLVSAEKCTEDFIFEINNSSLSELQKNYHLSWAYNVRGHVYAHTGRFANAAADAEEAYKILYAGMRKIEQEENVEFNVWLKEYQFAVFNLTIHQVYTGDEENEYDYSNFWYKRMDDVMTFIPRILMFDTFHWVDYHRNKLDIVNALKSTEEAIADARKYKHGQIYIYTVCAADFNYRLGNIEKALDYFKRADKLRPIYNDLFYFLNINWFEGVCLMKLGRYEDAEAVFLQELKNNPTVDYRIQLITRLAMIAAIRTNKNEFETLMNTAIDEAVELGELNLLIQVAIASCRCLLEIDDKENASEALLKVIELRDSAIENNVELSKTVLLDSCIIQLTMNGYSHEIVEQVLTVLPEALNDIESWQHIDELAAFVEEYQNQLPDSAIESKLKKSLEVFHFVSQQRAAHIAIRTQQV
jgi:tetratricopeptide (TPR) repeat protein